MVSYALVRLPPRLHARRLMRAARPQCPCPAPRRVATYHGCPTVRLHASRHRVGQRTRPSNQPEPHASWSQYSPPPSLSFHPHPARAALAVQLPSRQRAQARPRRLAGTAPRLPAIRLCAPSVVDTPPSRRNRPIPLHLVCWSTHLPSLCRCTRVVVEPNVPLPLPFPHIAVSLAGTDCPPLPLLFRLVHYHVHVRSVDQVCAIALSPLYCTVLTCAPSRQTGTRDHLCRTNAAHWTRVVRAPYPALIHHSPVSSQSASLRRYVSAPLLPSTLC